LSDIEEKDSSNMATGGVSEDDAKLLQAFRLLGLQTKFETPEELLSFAQDFKHSRMEPHTPSTPRYDAADSTHRAGTHHFPKLSVYFGDEGKGDVTWPSFKFEVESLEEANTFTSEQILFGIRRSLKESAGDKIRRLGPGVSIRQVMAKLESAYGNIESKESVLRKFYSVQQKDKETVETFASRLEELFDQAVKLNALRRSESEVLKQVLHTGLRKDLRHLSIYHADKITDYDEFKRELRKMEAELEENVVSEKKVCKPVINMEKKDTNEVKELREIVEKLQNRIDILEKEKKDTQYQQNRYDGHLRYRGRGTSEYRGGPRGRGVYRPQRPTAGNTFVPTCYHCNERGHMKRDCPLLGVVCFKCNERGHKIINCPKV